MWKTGILGGLSALVLGLGIFVLSSMITPTVSPACVEGVTTCNDTPRGGFFQGYADIWLSVIAKECVGGNGPDSCIGPNVGIMATSLFVVGFAIGGAIGVQKKKARPVIDEPGKA